MLLNDSAISQQSRIDPRSAFLIGLHALALVLFVIEPKVATAIVAFVAVATLAFRRPAWLAILALAFVWINDPLADFLPMTKFTAWKDVLLLVTLIVVASQNLLKRGDLVPRHALALPVLVVIVHFIAMCLLSDSAAQIILGLKNSIFYMSWFFLIPLIIRTRRDMWMMVYAIFFACTSIAIYNLWRIQQPWGTFPPRRDGTILDGASQAHWAGAPFLLPLAILLGSALIPFFQGWRRWLMYAIVLVCLASLVAAGSRAQTAGVLLAIATIGFLARKPAQVVKLLALAVVAAVLVQTTMTVSVSDRAQSAFNDQDVSRQAREDEAEDLMIPFILTHPFGAGTGSMTASKSGTVWATNINSALQGGMIHNNFLYVAIETGWTGMVAWAWMLYVALRSAYDSFRNARDPAIRYLSLGVLAILMQYTFMHFFAGVLTSQLISYYIWFIFGLVVVLPRFDHDPADVADTQSVPAATVGVGT